MRLHQLPIFAGAMLALASTASATQDRGWYVGLEAGANILEDTDVVVDIDPGPTVTGSAEFDTGWAGFFTAGYAFTPNWRAELELGFRHNDIDAVCSPVCVPTVGDVTQFTQMLNVIYDWRLAERWSLATGLGIGGDYIEVETAFGGDQDYVLAGQALLGLNYHVTERMDVTLNYRYLISEESSFTAENPLSPGDFNDLAIDNLSNHTISIGLRWDLHPTVSAPKTVTPPPREPARQYIVFFGFNKYNLTSEAQQVVSEAAAAAKQMGTASILVTGHTDTVGGNAYNNRLSQKRADVVRDELNRLGVTSKITATGRGETELLVQTADNVKEPQNRRATIDLQ